MAGVVFKYRVIDKLPKEQGVGVNANTAGGE